MQPLRKQEADEEDGDGAEDDGEVFVDAAVAQRDPGDDEEPADHTDGSIDVASLAREESQQEQAEHATGEDAGEFPPRVEDAVYIHQGQCDEDA